MVDRCSGQTIEGVGMPPVRGQVNLSIQSTSGREFCFRTWWQERISIYYFVVWTGELGMVDEAQKAMEEAEALKKVSHTLKLFCI